MIPKIKDMRFIPELPGYDILQKQEMQLCSSWQVLNVLKRDEILENKAIQHMNRVEATQIIAEVEPVIIHVCE